MFLSLNISHLYSVRSVLCGPSQAIMLTRTTFLKWYTARTWTLCIVCGVLWIVLETHCTCRSVCDWPGIRTTFHVQCRRIQTSHSPPMWDFICDFCAQFWGKFLLNCIAVFCIILLYVWRCFMNYFVRCFMLYFASLFVIFMPKLSACFDSNCRHFTSIFCWQIWDSSVWFWRQILYEFNRLWYYWNAFS